MVYDFADQVNGAPAGSVAESLLNTPMTAHIMGGVPFGRDADEGVIDLDCQVFNYPGLSVADNSIIPANPGVNPSLTCTALAEYAMSRVPPKPGFEHATPLNETEPSPLSHEVPEHTKSAQPRASLRSWVFIVRLCFPCRNPTGQIPRFHE